MNVDSIDATIEAMEIIGEETGVFSSIQKINADSGVEIYQFHVSCNEKHFPEPITLRWKIPAVNVKGVWKPTTDFSKRIQADWELEHMESRISIDAPVISLFGHNDENVITFACSNAINKLQMNARIREEDNYFYCHITFFSEEEQPIENFTAQIRIDTRKVLFSTALNEVSTWWETFEDLKPATVPAIAKMPLYSTWYQFHQNLDLELLLEECKLASDLGYKAIIIDDGWQTFDNNRGYDYTGDWKPERIPNMAEYVQKIHNLGLKAAIWFSVPFCGPKSEAFKRFKGKFLTENHRWAPVFDPRYPEVREYLINIYANAVREWNLDGLKLDFIDDFRLYESTPLGLGNGRDYASINEAVDRLMTDVMKNLQAINPDIFIEFRQKYVGPAMRKFGNMLRAFDCPGDATMNRIRIADIRMLSGNTAVHSDMVTWHDNEPVELAALQLINTLFGVPQLSMFISKVSFEHKKMIAFYTDYWNRNADVLMNGDFIPSKPLANYPLQKVSKNGKTVYGVYDPYVIEIENADNEIHVLNGQISNEVVIRNANDFAVYQCTIFDCQGAIVEERSISFSKGVLEIAVPPCGILIAKKI
jgi:alpha-galactosidase